jgi:hypothetical protein
MGENSPNLVTRLKGQAKARSKLKKGSFVNPSDKFLKKFFKKLYLYSISGLTRGQFSTSPYVQRFAPPGGDLAPRGEVIPRSEEPLFAPSFF